MKKKYIFLGSILLFLVVLTIIYLSLPQKIAILSYHDFTTREPNGSMQKNIDDFEKEMKYLKKHHYKTLKLKDIDCFMQNKCKLPRKSVMIVMDDGWKSEYELALPVLKKYNLNATLFYIGKNYDQESENYINKDDLEKIKKEYKNIEIASHSYNNHVEDGYLKTTEEIQEDLKLITDEVNKEYYAYPYGKYSDNYIKALKSEGYKYAFTFGPDKEHRKFSKTDHPYKIPRLNLSTTYPYYKYVLRLVLPI